MPSQSEGAMIGDASANAGYALAFEAERGPSRGPALESAADCESRR